MSPRLGRRASPGHPRPARAAGSLRPGPLRASGQAGWRADVGRPAGSQAAGGRVAAPAVLGPNTALRGDRAHRRPQGGATRRALPAPSRPVGRGPSEPVLTGFDRPPPERAVCWWPGLAAVPQPLVGPPLAVPVGGEGQWHGGRPSLRRVRVRSWGSSSLVLTLLASSCRSWPPGTAGPRLPSGTLSSGGRARLSAGVRAHGPWAQRPPNCKPSFRAVPFSFLS